MSRYWDGLVCPRCGEYPNALDIELAMRHENLTTKHGSYTYHYFNCGNCKRKVVIHMFTEDLTERKLNV